VNIQTKPMKAISLWQPYASLIACGAKPFETRDWAPPPGMIGQPIAICAAKKIDREIIPFVEDLMYGQHEDGGFDLADKLDETMSLTPDELLGLFGQAVMPIGCVVATAILDAAFQLGEKADFTARPAARVIKRMVSRHVPECFTVRYDDLGDYAPGRWAWLLRDVKALNPPIAVRGHQKIFDLPQGWDVPQLASP
jgi:activating signal cointegrator 1